jgi:hypothetical protein
MEVQGPNILSPDGLLQDVLATPATANTKQVEVPKQAGVEKSFTISSSIEEPKDYVSSVELSGVLGISVLALYP